MRLDAVTPPELRDLLANLPIGRPTQPIIAPDGAMILAVCSRETRNLAEVTPEQARDQILRERVELVSRQVLRDPQRRAQIDIRSVAPAAPRRPRPGSPGGGGKGVTVERRPSKPSTKGRGLWNAVNGYRALMTACRCVDPTTPPSAKYRCPEASGLWWGGLEGQSPQFCVGASMTASDLPSLRDAIARHGLDARKSLGQHFLLDPGVCARIAGGR